MLGREGREAVKTVLDSFQITPNKERRAEVEIVEETPSGCQAVVKVGGIHSKIEVNNVQ